MGGKPPEAAAKRHHPKGIEGTKGPANTSTASTIADTSKKGSDWPREAIRRYDKVKFLGHGTFGAVYKAKRKNPGNKSDQDDAFAAIKTIKANNPRDRAYIQREIDILSELNHPNIIKLKEVIQSAAMPDVYLVCLQFVEGPSIFDILKKGGALGLPLARLISQQLIAVVSYLHTRAVIHRDLKPDNMLLQYSSLEDLDLWKDDESIEVDVAGDGNFITETSSRRRIDAKEEGSNNDSATTPATTTMKHKRWKLMLIDFGLSRALAADNIASVELKARVLMRQDSLASLDERMKRRTSEAGGSMVGSLAGFDEEQGDTLDQKVVVHREGGDDDAASRVSRGSEKGSSGNRRSSFRRMNSIRTTRMKYRTLSAVGTKDYAAPEIEKGFRKKEDDAYDALSACVADYGMEADSFSVGCVLREMLTGVPPNQNVEDFIKKHSKGGVGGEEVACGCFGGGGGKATTSNGDSGSGSDGMTQQPRFRRAVDIPQAANEMIGKLLVTDPSKRHAVRELQDCEWISGSNVFHPIELPKGDVSSNHNDPISFLNCATRDYNAGARNATRTMAQ